MSVRRGEERRLGLSDITMRADGVSILKVGGQPQPQSGQSGQALSRPDRFQIDTNRSQPFIRYHGGMVVGLIVIRGDTHTYLHTA